MSKVSVCEGRPMHPSPFTFNPCMSFDCVSVVITLFFYWRWWTGHLKTPLCSHTKPSFYTNLSPAKCAGGLHLGDIHFAKIQTTLWMQTVPITVLEKWAEDGSFNRGCMAEGDCSCNTTILILLNPNAEGTALENASVGLIVWQCMGPVGHICTIMKLIKYARSLMKVEQQSSDPVHRTICTIVGNYGRHMAFSTDPPFCTGLFLVLCSQRWSHPNDLQESAESSHFLHHRRFIGLSVTHALDCWLHKYMMDRCHGCLLIPRAVHFLPNLFPQILIPHNHASSIPWSPDGTGCSICHLWPLCMSMDTLFHGTAGDLELYTAEEVVALRNAQEFSNPRTLVHLLLNYHHLLHWGRLCFPLWPLNCLTTIPR